MKKIYYPIIALFFTLFLSQKLIAQQAGTSDPTFNLADSSIAELRGELNQTVITLANGKILAGGTRLVRFYESGYVDKGFFIGTANGAIRAIQEQPDGKVIIGGDFTVFNGKNKNYIVRLNLDGTIDNSFSTGTNGLLRTISLQADGKIIVGGDFTFCNGINTQWIARLYSNGSVDTTLSLGTGFNNAGLGYGVTSSKIQPDGKILIGGGFTFYNGNISNFIVRLNTNGSYDNSFASGTGFNSLPNCIALQTNGKIVVGGAFTDYNGTTANYIVRLNANGSIDNTFSTGTAFDNSVYSLIIEPAGKIIAIGQFSSFNGNSSPGIVRINISGSIDNTFTIGSGTVVGWLSSLTRLPNGKIIICGPLSTNFNGFPIVNIVELNNTGGIFNDFGNISGFNGLVSAIALQADGKSIIGGVFTNFNGILNQQIARLNIDGTIDSTFHTGTGFIGINAIDAPGISSIKVQNDARIIITGDAGSFDGNPIGYIVRLEADGIQDTTFLTTVLGGAFVSTSLITPDGKIIIGGCFSSVNGVNIGHNGIARVNIDGTTDTTFIIGSGFIGATMSQGTSPFCSALQPDGKLIFGGGFADYDGNSSAGIVRINSDGSYDNSFITGNGFDSQVRAIAIQPNGKILIGGYFTNYAGIIANRIIRLNANGSRDLTFNAGSGFDGAVRSIAIQADGNILIGGEFTSYNANPANRIIRLKPDGSIDQTFELGTGFNNTVSTLALQTDDKVLVGGAFTTFNGKVRNRIERLYNNSCTSDIAVNTTDASCGQNNGSITLGAVTGGVAPYTYNVNNLGYSSTTLFNGVSEGGYDLLVRDANGCEFSAPQITVLGSPTPYDVSVTTSNSACGNSNGSATIGFVSGGTFPYQYNFNGQGFTTNATYSNIAAGSYSLEVRDANNCTYTAPNVTVVNDDINYNVSFSSNDTLLAAPPFNVNFSNLTTDTTSTYFTWYFGDGSSYAGVTPPTHVYTINGNYTVSLLAINKTNGCTDTLTLPNYITCSGGPTGLCNQIVSINEASPINGCVGGNATLSCNTNAAQASYQWNLNGVPIGGATQSTFTALFSGYYNVTVYNYGDCPITSVPVAVSFNNTSPARPTISQFGIIQPCSNDTVILSVSPGFNAYLWSNGDTARSIKVGSAGYYTVTGINANGCNSISLPQVVSASPLQAPDICMVTVDTGLIKNSILWEKTPNLQIDSFVVFKETAVAGIFRRIGANAYSALSEFVDTSSRPLIRSDRYRLAIKDTCGSLTIPGAIHKTMHLQITPGIGTSRNLSWNPQEGIYFPSYEIWSGNPPTHPFAPIDTIASTQNTYTDLAPVDGIDTKYLIQIVLPSGGCTSTARTNATKIRSGSNTAGNRIIAIPNPLNVPSIRSEEISISPNPSNGVFTILITVDAVAQVFVYDILGNEILNKNVSKLNNQKLDLSAFPSGFYECRIIGERMNVAKKLVKN